MVSIIKKNVQITAGEIRRAGVLLSFYKGVHAALSKRTIFILRFTIKRDVKGRDIMRTALLLLDCHLTYCMSTNMYIFGF